MTRSSLARGIAAACMFATIPPAFAETFIMVNGDVIEGTVVRAFGNTLSIKFEGAGMRQVPIANVQRIEIATQEGGVIGGRLEGWSNGTYRLSTDRGVLEASVENGVATALTDAGTQGAAETVAAAPVDAVTDQETEPDTSALRAGFVYHGLVDDGGRTFIHEKGRLKLAQNPLVEQTAVLEIGSEDKELTKSAIDQLVADGANVVFMTGHDSAEAIVESSKRHGDTRFVHCGALVPSPNVGVFCGRIYQARYLTGMIAGGMTESGSVGYVAAKPTPETIVEINAFTLGAQSINPNVEVVVNWTNSWYAPAQAQARAEELVERGIDVLTLHQDSPAALQVAERHGIDAIGYQSDMSVFAPSSTLTSATWNWGRMYALAVDHVSEGNTQLRPTWLGLREGVVGLAPLSDRVPDDLKQLVQQRQRDIADGRFQVFSGPIRDVDGDIRVLNGRTMTDENLQTMDYLIEGVVGY
ncbi:MAG: BMP family ABC transporter substrate-binding protein [Geminicoccaceae bacterium]